MQVCIKTSLVNENVIINFSLIFKRLKHGVYLDPGLLNNNILKCFRWPTLYGNNTVCPKHYSFKNKSSLVMYFSSISE